MEQNKIRLLCTRTVSRSLVRQARSAGLSMDVVSFIETEPIQSIEVQQEIQQVLTQIATVVFTSTNAVEAVAAELEGQQPDWQIFCTANATKELVKKYYGDNSIGGTAEDAAGLAEVIMDRIAEKNEVIFFCGDQRRAELPEKLAEKGIDIIEIVVYQTIPIPHRVNGIYEGIIFFSPTAVKSFFQVNKISGKTIFFAIGDTTAAEIKKYSANRIIVASEPGKERLVETAIGFFHV